jgi:hypothetical protein
MVCELDAELSARKGPILTVLSDDIILCLVGIRLVERSQISGVLEHSFHREISDFLCFLSKGQVKIW